MYGIDQCALAHATVTADQCDFSGNERTHFLDADVLHCGCDQGSVASVLVGVFVFRQHVQFFFGVVVDLVEDNYAGHTVYFSGHQETIDEPVGGSGPSKCNEQDRLIHVRSDHLLMVREVHTAPHDVIGAVVQFHDRTNILFVLLGDEFHTVANSQRIGALPPFDAQIAFGHAFVQRAVLATHEVAAAGGAHDKS